MSKNKYEDLINQVVDLVGGKANISLLTHCITRLRFNLKDKSKVWEDEIEKLGGVIGLNWAGDQLQLIIGQKVGAVYQEVCKKYDLEVVRGIDENLDEKNGKRRFGLSAFLDAVTGCIIPALPILMGSGMLKLVLLLATMCNIMQSTDSTYIVLNFASDAGFYFLPVFVGGFAAKKFNTSQPLGMMIGAMLIHPTFIASVAAGESLSVFGLPIYGATYTSSFFSAILAVYVMSYVERFFRKYSPEALAAMCVPLGTLLVMIPLTFCALAPLGTFIGVYISGAMIWLYEKTGFLGVALLGAIRPFLVMTGMHTAFTPYLLHSLSTLGYEPFYGPTAITTNINQGISCLAVGIKAKNKKVKALAFSCALTAAVGGITEPAMYGINLKYKTPMIGAMVGSAISGAYLAIMHVYMFAIASGGIFGIVQFVSEDPMTLVNGAIGLVVGSVVTFVLTYMLYKEKEEAAYAE